MAARGRHHGRPRQTYIDATVRLGRDVTLFPGTILQGATVVGDGCEIGPDTRLVDCVVGDGAVVEHTVVREGDDRRRRPRRSVRRAANRAPSLRSGTVTGAFYTGTGRRAEAREQMERVTKKRLALYSGRSHLALAEEIADHLGVELGDANLVEFANGEMHPRFAESVRGADVFIIQTHYGCDGRSINDSIMEQLIMIDAANRASAKRITAVCPFYGYARQDRKAEGREPITAKLVADMFRPPAPSAWCRVDLHSGQIQGFFDGPVDHLTAMPVLEDYMREHCDDPASSSSPRRRPGEGGRALRPAPRRLDADLAFVNKRRPKGMANVAEAKEVIGDVDGRHCVIIDDMIDTAGTIVAAAEILLERGATEVWAMATHGVLSGPAIDRLKNSAISRVVVTNTLPLPPEKQIDKIEVLSVAPIIADAIDAVFEDTSVSEIFGGENQA